MSSTHYTPFTRRRFLTYLGISSLSSILLPLPQTLYSMPIGHKQARTPLHIKATNANFEREPLLKPFGFKGSAMTEVWQTIAMIEGDSEIREVGLGTQNVLWSDARVFAKHSENGGNALMFAMTEMGLKLIRENTYTDPINMLDQILDPVWEYGKQITGQQDLRKTFALNALVPVDNAAWLLYAHLNDITDFDTLIPTTFKPALSHRHPFVASIPALGYGTEMKDIKKMADEGFFIMKIKIGAPGSQQEMLEKDKAFLKAIHDTIGHYTSPHTDHGKIPYYFDANGRYEKKDTLWQLLEYAKKIGALDQIAVIEEPFGELNEEDVSDFPVIIAADESAHTDEDALRRIEQGYSAVALKAIAKTLSMTLKIAKVCHDHNIPCFCADLTVNPILVDWNKNVAARLAPFPGMASNMGLQETNGHQNYLYWDQMMSYHPVPEASWVTSQKGLYHTDDAFYRESGGIFAASEHYSQRVL